MPLVATSNSTSFLLYRVIGRIFLRRTQGVNSRPLRHAALLALFVAMFLVAKYGLYDQLSNFFAIFGAGSSLQQAQLLFLVTASAGAVSLCIELAFSLVAIRPPSEAVVALPIQASRWHEANVNIYVLLVSVAQATFALAAILSATAHFTLSSWQLVGVVSIEASATLILALGLRLILLCAQGLEMSGRTQVTLGASLAILLGLILAHVLGWDTAVTQFLSQWVTRKPLLAAVLAFIVVGPLTWASGHVDQQISRRHHDSVKLSVGTSKSGLSLRLPRWLPPLTWASIVVLLRDRPASLLVGSGLSLLLVTTVAARSFHNASGVTFTISFSPYLYALFASTWMSRLRAYLGRSRLAVYALPVPPMKLIVQQGLAMSLLLSVGGILLTAAQSL
jgi:hypothetical protein